MRKITQNRKKDYTSPRSLFTIKPEEQFSSGVYGFVPESILLKIQYPETNEDGFSYIKEIYSPANDSNSKSKSPIYRTTKEIADSLLEKEEIKKTEKREKRYYIEKLLENEQFSSQFISKSKYPNVYSSAFASNLNVLQLVYFLLSFTI